MTITLSQIWQKFQQSFSVAANLNTAQDTGKAILAATPKINDSNVSLEAVKTLLQESSSLLDILCLPLAQIVNQELSFVSLGVNFLNLYAQTTQTSPTLEECVFIISQTAYLQSIKEILSLYPLINWDTNLEHLQELKIQLGKLPDIELDYQTAQNTISCFQESDLAVAFNQIFLARLISPNVTKFLGNLLTKRIAVNTHRHIINALTAAREEIKNLMRDVWEEWEQEKQIIQGVDEYLTTYIESQPLATFFDQSYSGKDIYIPLKAKPVHKNANSLDLEAWVKGILLNDQKLEQVMLIQGEPGSGKSLFCIMFADWVRQHLHPLFTPILIKLKDLQSLSVPLEYILQSEINSSITNYLGLLNHKNTKFLFILDGLDDLNTNLEVLLQEVSNFQKKCQVQDNMGHRLLITVRNNSLQYISKLPHNLERVEIIDLDKQLQEKWLQKWANLPENKGKKTDLEQYLSSKKCPGVINKLALRPFYLHFLALMYRDDTLVFNNLEKANQKNAKVLILQEFVNWLIAKLQANLDDGNVYDLENPNYQSYLKNLLTEAGLVIFQSGGVLGSLEAIKSRLQDPETDIFAILNKFYFSHSHNREDQIECFHKTFSEFLFAQKITQSLQNWSMWETDEQIQEMNWQIYDLLGFGKINPEIAEYVIGSLTQIPNLYWINLFKILDNFYTEWCQGKFIDTPEETLAQIKLKQLQKFSKNDRIDNLGQRQIDIYAGLNVMILLLEIQRYAQEHDVLKEYIIFYPSGDTQGDNLTSDLLRLINYCNCLREDSFKSILGQFFSATHLRATYLFQADLSGMDLSQADLSRAELSRSYLWQTNLSNAYLIAAKLIQADLRGANLSGANMIRTDLRGADLSYANLEDADLSRVDLSGTNLKGANLSGAYMTGVTFGDEVFGYVRWDSNTNWKDVEGLETAKNLPVALRKQLKLE
jgi:uncharacterized protein YjbI with pentapeptide repeats